VLAPECVSSSITSEEERRAGRSEGCNTPEASRQHHHEGPGDSVEV
jgi:hypothetical protein